MLDQRVRIAERRDDRQLAIAAGDSQGRDPTRHCLHSEVEDGFSDGGKACRIGERTRQSPCGSVERPWGAAATRRAAQIASEGDEILRGPSPISLEDQDNGSARCSRQANQRPLMVIRTPDIDTEAKGQANAIECLGPSVDQVRERRKGRGLHCDNPRALVPAGNRSLGPEHAADQGNKLTKELSWGCRRGDTLRNLQKRALLVG
jgi:hypothetical protein